MQAAIPQEILDRWPRYFEIESASPLRDEYEQIYLSTIRAQSFSIDFEPNTSFTKTIFKPPRAYEKSFSTWVPASATRRTRQERAGAWAGAWHSSIDYNSHAPWMFDAGGTIYADSRIINVSMSVYGFSVLIAAYPWARLSRYASNETQYVDYAPKARADVSISPVPFNGLASLAALAENGVTLPDFNAATARTVLAYISGVEKFGSEIAIQIENIEHAERAKTATFAQDLGDKISRDRSAMQQQALAIRLAVDNELAGTKRDLQNLIINAANLRL